MIAYADTSVLVAALTEEVGSLRAEQWLTRADLDILISDWTVTEFSSVLALKVRTRQITAAGQDFALAAFQRMIVEGLTVLIVTRAHFRTAATFCDRHDASLRAPDSLHLAVASSHGATLWTLDRRLAEAGERLGVSATLL